MVLTGRDKLESFAEKHADARSALHAWAELIRKSSFKHFQDLKQTFGTVDYVKPCTIFDIKGNRYRVIAVVNYREQICAVHQALTHEQYERRRAK